MDTNLTIEPPAWDVAAYLDDITDPLITAIRRDQMPEDIGSAFLPQDIILINKPRDKDSAVSQTLAQVRRKLSPIGSRSKCSWCRANDICLRLILALAGFVWLGVSAIRDREAFAVYAFSYFIITVSVYSTPLTSVPASIQSRTGRVNRRCSRGVKQHHAHGLASFMLSPSSLVLLQEPIISVRSLFRYCQFFNGTRGQDVGLSQQEVDSCIQHHAAQGGLSTGELIGDGSHALLWLGPWPCRDRLADFGWGLSWLTVFHDNYRDWKRWRLATVVCEAIQAGDDKFLQLSDTYGYSSLDGFEVGGSRKWFLVDPKLFSSRLR